MVLLGYVWGIDADMSQEKASRVDVFVDCKDVRTI